jgi:putative restriction endonuclease
MDRIRPLAGVTGRFVSPLESAFLADGDLVNSVARDLVTSNGRSGRAGSRRPGPGVVLGAGAPVHAAVRHRDPRWRHQVLQAWDRQCAFCGFDGQLAGVSIGVEAAHVRWFNFDGPDTLDNGLALCALHHKLFDFGVLGLDGSLRVLVSSAFAARTDAGRAVYGLHQRMLSPRPGTQVPAPAHISWHREEVFKAEPLAA